jgi:hypothetical protein
MMMLRRRDPVRLPALGLAICLLFLAGTPASAQLKGHYIPGFTGLENGTQPPPGINLALPIYAYPTDTIKDANGDSVGVSPSITASFVGAGLVIVTPAKILGANYGVQVIPIAFMKSRIEGNSLDVPGSFGFTDIYVQPVWLGWTTPRADYSVGYGFFVPTGKWNLGSTDNAGLGMWSHDLQAGTTVRLDNKRQWSTSGLTTLEMHSTKKESNLQVGDILTLEGGTGRAFYEPVSGSHLPRIVKVGAVYYGQFKVSADSGNSPLLDPLLADGKDRVFGAGGEASIFLPKARLLLDARVVAEFGAHTRTQGLTMLFSAAYQLESLVKAPKP